MLWQEVITFQRTSVVVMIQMLQLLLYAICLMNSIYIRSGAGIVYDSVPEKEAVECINKAKAVVNAIKQAEGGLE